MKLKSKLLLALLATSSAAFAQTAPAAPEVTYNVGVVSQYRYRGLAQSKGQPAVQGGFDYANSSGYYLGVWGSTINWIKDSSTNSNNVGTQNYSYTGSVELDLYGGFKFENAGINYDIGFLRYEYPSNTLSSGGSYSNPATNELYGAATIGIYTFKWSHAVSTLFGTLNSKGSDYFDLTANYDLGNGLTLAPHVGRQIVAGGGGLSYTDVAVTLSKDLGGGISASVSGIATNATSSLFKSNYTGYQTGKPAIVVGLKYGF
jgi:uncharacterized protein (TIGR02001 family)